MKSKQNLTLIFGEFLLSLRCQKKSFTHNPPIFFMITLDTIVIIFIQVLSIIGYFLTSKYQSKQIEILKNSLENQKDLLKSQADTIKTFDDYKKLINLDDVKENLQLKIDNLHLEYKKAIAQRDREISEAAILSAAKTFTLENKKILRAWNELLNINAQFIMSRYPDKSNTVERDQFINELIPFNAEFLIPMINAWTSGELEKFMKENPYETFLSDDNTPQES